MAKDSLLPSPELLRQSSHPSNSESAHKPQATNVSNPVQPVNIPGSSPRLSTSGRMRRAGTSSPFGSPEQGYLARTGRLGSLSAAVTPLSRTPPEPIFVGANGTTNSTHRGKRILPSLPPLPPSIQPPAPPNPRELLRLAPGVVKSRTGSVLSRGFILKADFRPSAFGGLSDGTTSFDVLDGGDRAAIGSGVHLRGAPNFRMADCNIFGTAQPTETGLRTILSVLKSQPVLGPNGERHKGRETVWFSTREEPVIYIGAQPFVLRDAAYPTRTYALSDRAENLEAIENRLKHDILKESARYGGVILVQEEIGNEEIMNTWVAADLVRTVRELWEEVAAEGYNLQYHRVPITRDQSPEDQYLDTYTEILSSIPTSSSLVFNCGIGVVRTTFAMSAALIVRRRQLLLENADDPYAAQLGPSKAITSGEKEKAATRVLLARNEQAARDRSLLRLMHVLQKSLASTSQQTVLTLLSTQPQLLENLRTALLGQYDLILSLLSTLDEGQQLKKLVDVIVDHCEDLVNLRESVLQHRVRYASLALLDDESSREHRAKALAALERYFFLVTFAAYVQDSSDKFPVKFSKWLASRPEVANMISRMRKTGHFYVFSPVHDLSAIAKGEAGSLSGLDKGKVASLQRTGGVVIGDEWARQIVQTRGGIILRTGMILKNDQWAHLADGQESTVRGAINFRRVPHSSLYGLSQPTQEGIDRVLETVKKDLPGDGAIAWINLREEPLIYINGTPYVLRQEAVSLRNVKSYAGISSTRLELLEDRLKKDILAELNAFDHRLLLHTEGEDGTVNPVWEIVESESDVKTLREIMDLTSKNDLASSPLLQYRRIPITAEKSPDFNDVREIVEMVAQQDIDKTAIIVNCQLGRGRSTRAQVIVSLVQRWLKTAGHRATSGSDAPPRSTRYSYTVVNNLLRTIRNGQEIKNVVDAAITACSGTYDLLGSIEDARQAAEEAKDNATLKTEKVRKGILQLRGYFFLLLFASFLNESKAETWRELREKSSYEQYVQEHPYFKTIERELDTAGIEALQPLEKPEGAASAQSDEVAEFVAKRNGRILSPFTLLKSDYFSGLQKMSLPERVDGAPNFRKVKLFFSGSDWEEGLNSSSISPNDDEPLLFGTGMPTVEGLRRALERMGANHKSIVWTSMREEPVIYVSGGRPHVLRLYDAPLENVVTTGVTAEIVEAMESALKTDLLNEAERNGGKVLLHDEIEEPDGSFSITASWEEIKPGDLLTPREVFATMRNEGLQVDYERLPVTDEQAPIPGVYTRIEERVTYALGENSETVGFVFNCQMGRGRTTTGMVAAALVSNILFNYPTTSSSLSGSQMMELETDPQTPSAGWDGRESEPYLCGEYKIVLQLVGVMQHGKIAKKFTDKAIDNMEGVQNLRRAIYDFKLRVEAADDGSKKQKKLFDIAVNYLFRYGTLITFAEYLIEKAEATGKGRGGQFTDTDDDESLDRRMQNSVQMPPFKKWLSDRREISRILSKKTLD